VAGGELPEGESAVLFVEFIGFEGQLRDDLPGEYCNGNTYSENT
jgi:hypothetical protein